MPMSPGNQAITGGTVLRSPAIQSPNYVPGVSGWIISIDGSAEFNNGTFRGSIEVGPVGAAHFIVNNPATGDVIDVYNSSNQLVFAITGAGDVKSLSPFDTRYTVLTGAVLEFLDSAQTPQTPPEVVGVLTADLTKLGLNGGTPQNAVGGISPAALALITGDALTSPWIEATQRGLSGAVVQTDSAVNGEQLIHVETYTFNTDASGNCMLAHHANFTPKQGFLVGLATGVGPFFEYAWFANPFTSTTANGSFKTATGANYANINGAGAFGIFVG